MAIDPFAELKFKPLARGKQRDTFTLSEPGLAVGHILEGAVRSAKTIVSIMRWLEFVLHGPPGNLLMIGKTERSLRRNVLDTIVLLLGPKRAKIIAGAGYMRICGRMIYLAGANDEGAVSRIQGLTLVGFYGDEAPTWPKAVFDMARTRCSDPGAEWFVTGNPAASTHYLNVDWIARAKLHLQRDGSVVRRSMRDPDVQDVHVYSFTIYDNPFLTPEFVQLLERSYTGVFKRRYIDGIWCMAEGAIYDGWDPGRHILPWAELPAMDRWISLGVDYGTTNPFHAVDLAIGPAPRGRQGKALYTTSEWRWDSRRRNRQLDALDYAQHLIAWQKALEHPGAPAVRGAYPDVVAVDPSANSFRVTLLKMGVTTAPADNSVLAGIHDLQMLIQQDRFYISDRAPELAREIPNYAWDERAAKLHGVDQPMKVDDHGCDAERYATRSARTQWWDEIFPEQLDVALVESHQT